MEYTVEFCKSSVKQGKTVIHETTLCEPDETTLKREVTKIAKTLDAFQQLQAECPVSWDSWGYDNTKSFSKRWTHYDKNFPLDEENVYSIHIMQTSGKFATAEKRVYIAGSKTKEALEALTDQHHAFNPDITKIDPEIAEIIHVDLPKHVQALIDVINGVEKRLSEKIQELNEKE